MPRHLATKRKADAQDLLEDQQPIEQVPREAWRSRDPLRSRNKRTAKSVRLDISRQAIALPQLGMSHAAIAEAWHRPRHGEQLACRCTYPETTRGPSISRIDSSLPYLFQQWKAGCHKRARPHQERVARGYEGTYASVQTQECINY